VTEWFLPTKFHVGIETCLVGNGETSKANIVRAKERKWVFFCWASAWEWTLLPTHNTKKSGWEKISRLKGSCIEEECRKERCFV